MSDNHQPGPGDDEFVGREFADGLGDELMESLKTIAGPLPCLRVDEGLNYEIIPFKDVVKMSIGVWSPVESVLDNQKYIPEGIYDADKIFRVRIHQNDRTGLVSFEHRETAQNVLERIFAAFSSGDTLELDEDDGVIPVVENDRHIPNPYLGNRCVVCGTEDVKLRTDTQTCIPCDEDYDQS